jgi:penicillin-binding protein 2
MSYSLGNAFPDNLITSSKSSSKLPIKSARYFWQGAGRVLVVSAFLNIAVAILVGRLFMLTVVEGHRYRVLADDNRTKELVRHAPRGIMYDRAGVPLVQNIPRFRLLSPCKDKAEELCSTTISEEEGEKMTKDGLPPLHFLEVDYLRKYLLPQETAHVVGYTGEISDSELKDDYFILRKYMRADSVGRTAAEAVFEERLRGRNGKELVEVDAQGKILRVLGVDPELPGENIHLSIDAELSKTIASVFPKDKKGAVVVSKPDTGEILALYSNPSFNLNNFTLGMTDKEYAHLIDNPDRPLFNRAIGGMYPPGSTYKIVTSLAGIEEGVVTRTTQIEDTGVITMGPYSFPNWYFLQYGKTDGMLDITRAIARSNDIFFYKVGEGLGITKLRDWSKKMGLGAVLGIELPGESAGLLPSADWKRKTFVTQADLEARQQEWYLGDTYHMSIGQGYLLTTPLQVNTWTAEIANGGKLCKPTILQIGGPGNDHTASCKPLPLKNMQTLDLITEGMRQACATGGTAYPFFDFAIHEGNDESSKSAVLKRIPVACKTGTAEYGSTTDNTHAWFTVFGPLPESDLPASVRSQDKVVTGPPEIAVTVLVEGAGEGSDIAAPVAKQILTAWFKRQ